MDTLIFGLSVTVIGMVVVFVGLVILICCVKGISALARRENKKDAPEAETKATSSSVAATMETSPSTITQGVSPEVLAAITAAIAAVWQGENGFALRHVKRVNNAPAWNRAGREEQTYSRF